MAAKAAISDKYQILGEAPEGALRRKPITTSAVDGRLRGHDVIRGEWFPTVIPAKAGIQPN